MVRSWSSARVSCGIAAQRLQRRAAPGAHRARHHGHRAQRRQRAALQVLGGDIFQRLPAGDQVAPVADQGVAGHRAHPWDRRTSGRAWPRVSGGNRVSASSATTISPLRLGQAAVQRARLAAVLEASSASRAARRRRPCAPPRRCASAGAVVQHQHLQLAPSRTPGSARTEPSITFSSLKQGISTLTSGPVAGSSIGGVRRSIVKRWTSASTPRNSSRATPSTMAVMNRACRRVSHAVEEAEADPVEQQLEGVAAGGRHGLGRRHAGQLADGHQLVAVGAQRIDQRRQGLRRCGCGRRRNRAAAPPGRRRAGRSCQPVEGALRRSAWASGFSQSSGSMRRPTVR